MSTDPQQATPSDERSGVLMDVSNTVVRLYKDLFGRGPTKARSYWVGPDGLATFLEDTLTHAERNMVRMGEQQRRATRACSSSTRRSASSASRSSRSPAA